LDRITVRRLSQEGTAAMIAAIIGDLEASEEFAEYVHRRTKGNPFFVDEMLRALGGHYRIIREIGAGGMGRVFEAVDTRTGNTVAAKIMFASGEASFDALLRFQQEGAVLATLKHPNIVEVYSPFTEEHASCIVMEMLEGNSLGEILRSGTLPLPRIKAIARQAAGALAYAHSKSIVHRDVKPDNIIVVGEDHVKVTDFGIARILRPDATINTMHSTGMSLGTPLYMAPEQVEGKRVDGRADVYSLGAVLYQMVTGRPPFEGTDPVTIAYKHVHEAPPPPSEIVADVPEDWEALILKALAKSPQDRFASAGEMEEAIEDLSPEPRPTGTVVAPHRRVPTPFARRREPTPPPSAPAESPPTPPPSPGLGFEALGNQISSLVEAQLAGTVSEIKEGLEKSRAARRGPAASALPVAAHPRRLHAPSLPAIMTPWRLVVAAVAILLIAGVVVWRSQPSSTHTFAFGKQDLSYGLPPPNPSPISTPFGLALDSQGDIYVCDTGSNTIRELSPSGNPLAVWPAPGSGLTLSSPTGVAVDSKRNVYIADSINNRVVELSASGRLVRQWQAQPGGNPATASGALPEVSALAIDPHGDVYTINAAANRVEKYSSEGRFLGQWAAPSAVFLANLTLAADAFGNVWVADPDHYRVDRFSSTGKLLSTFGASGPGAGQFDIIHQIATDSQGHVFVGDSYATGGTGIGRVQEFSQQGKLLATWGNLHTIPGLLSTPNGLAVDSRGDLYVSDPEHSAVKKLAPAGGTTLASWDGTRPPGASTLHRPLGITVDPQGHVYVSDTANARITRLSLQGEPDRSWGFPGSGRGQLSGPWNLASDSRGNVYVADSGNGRIDAFSSSGAFIRSIGSTGSGPGNLQNPLGVAVGAGGNVYVADSGNARVIEFSPAGKQIARWGLSSRDLSPEQVAVGRDGTVYVADGGTRAIYKLSSNLELIARFGSSGTGPGQFISPSGVSVDPRGNVYIADSGSNRIELFSPDGVYLARLGRSGSGPGQLNSPNGVAVDQQGNLYVADTGNNRVEKFFAGR
jgi:serine/threonine protein kinase/streptogramin lyase